MQTSISRRAQDPAEFLKSEAEAHGFDVLGVARPNAVTAAGRHLREFVSLGRHGTMAWMKDELDRRADPLVLWPEAKSIIMFGLNYGPSEDPLESLGQRDHATISVYARNKDYHQLIKGRLKTIAGRLKKLTRADVKVFVDTAPVMEKPLAAAAGLGWQGKHTNLVSRQMGSWLFLGSIFSAAEIIANEPETDACGSCRACLDVCPTKAFPAPYQLDAQRCISYLTIEHEGPVPHEFRPLMGNRIYGCDDCLAVCPWNKFAATAREVKLQARADLKSTALSFLLTLDDEAFRGFFSGSPIKRIGRNRFMRNVLIAAGNSGSEDLVPFVGRHLTDLDPVVRGAAIWAYFQLASKSSFSQARRAASSENDLTVLAEWAAGEGNLN